MSGDFPLEITGRYDKGREPEGGNFWSEPRLHLSAWADTAHLMLFIAVDQETGARLRALADQADAQFAEYTAERTAKRAQREGALS